MALCLSVPITLTVTVLSFICIVKTSPQTPEINDQFKESNVSAVIKEVNKTETNKTNEIKVPKAEEVFNTTNTNATIEIKPKTLIDKLYDAIACPISRLMSEPTVNKVFRNIGTCIVHGTMELISFYFPAPLIPLIASAAGLLIPFEPVVILKERMPVTSYRRALRTAMDGFMGTFESYKMREEDPYMTNRFNRRFMGNSKEIKGDDKRQND